MLSERLFFWKDLARFQTLAEAYLTAGVPAGTIFIALSQLGESATGYCRTSITNRLSVRFNPQFQ